MLTIMGTVVGAVWSLAWWLSKKFSDVKTLVFERIEKLETALEGKLEYHEKHDDERFNQIRNDLWEMRLQNAIHDTSRKSKDAEAKKS